MAQQPHIMNNKMIIVETVSTEKEHSDYYLDYQQLCNGSKEPWQLIDQIFKKDPLVLHDEVRTHCQEYHRRNLSIYQFKKDRLTN